MPKINQEEYEILKGLDDRWEWIARDEDRGLYAFTKKPVRKDGPSSYWRGADPCSALGLFDEIHLFQFIQWEDSEPYNIAKLIEEYEKEEKEMKKDIEWLKEQLDDIEMNTPRLWSHDSIWMLNRVNELLDQLDEPETVEQTTRLLENVLKENNRLGKLLEEKHEEWLELMDEINNQEVLSDKWIDEHITDGHNVNLGDKVVYADELDGVLVPKQKKVKKAQIPEWIIEWYQGANNEFSTLEDVFSNLSHDTGYNIKDREKLRSRIKEYGGFSRMYEALSHIYFGAYEIEEEEQKYYVVKREGLDGVHYYFSKFDDEMTGLFTLPNDKKGAYRFDDKEKAQTIANYTNSKVEELEE